MEDPFEVGRRLLWIDYWNVEQDHWKQLHIQNGPIVRLWLAVVPTRTPNNQRDLSYVSRMTFLLDHILSTMYTNHVYLIKVNQGAVWICAHGCVLCFHAFSVLFFFFFLQPHFLTKLTVNSISLYCLRVLQIILSVIFLLKMSSTILFTYLKIILLQYL